MNINYQDKNKKSIEIAVDEKSSAVLDVAAFDLGNIRVAASKFDLTDYQGSVFRLYAEENGDLSTDKWNCHYWMLAEAVIPEKKMKRVSTGKQDDHGSDIMTMEIVPLDLNTVDFTVFSLPDGEVK